MDTIQTTYHAYYFNLEKPDDCARYDELKTKLMGAQGLQCFETHGGDSHYQPKLDGQVLTLETKCLFDNQWNTAPVEGVSELGLRVFDWAQDYLPNKKIKRGHYLDQTADMAEVRRNTNKCGYCGKQEPAAKGYVFCPYCIDSEYLKEDDLHLTRMVPVNRTNESRTELSEAERAHLLPLYRDAQLHGTTERGITRIAKQRRDIARKAKLSIQNATFERDGMLWLLDRGIKIDNVIYYDHTQKFSFGWRQPVSESVKSELLVILTEFPFAYDVKSSKAVSA